MKVSTVMSGLAEELPNGDADSDSADTLGMARDELDRWALRLLVCIYVLASVLRTDTDL